MVPELDPQSQQSLGLYHHSFYVLNGVDPRPDGVGIDRN